MSAATDIDTDPFIIVVFEGEEEKEPAIILQSWLRDDNQSAMWPPTRTAMNSVCRRVTPKDNWSKYPVVEVYWTTG